MRLLNSFIHVQQREMREAEEQGEHRRAMEDARRMLRNGKLSTEDIADITQLPIEEVRQLQ